MSRTFRNVAYLRSCFPPPLMSQESDDNDDGGDNVDVINLMTTMMTRM